MHIPFSLKKFVNCRLPRLLTLSIIFIISFTLFPIISSSHLPIISNANAWSATYYVDATNGNDYYSGLSQSTPWKTIAKVNASRFNPGDQILFKRGETWREQLTVPSSGGVDKVITFGAYGSGALPSINGSNLISSRWTQYSSTVWQAAVTTRPKQLFFNGIRGTPVASVGAINAASKWYWARNVLYVYSTSNPATAFTNPGIEASQRINCIAENGKSYVKIQNLNLQNANGDGLCFNQAASNVTVDGCTVGHAYWQGITSVGTKVSQSITIQNCTVNWNGASGINVDTPSHDWTIQDNIVHNNCQLSSNDNSVFAFSSGIKGASQDASVVKILIQRNKVYSQGKLPDNSRVSTWGGVGGIWVDTFIHTSYANGAVITRNEVYDNEYFGIFLENSSYNTVTYNLVYNNIVGPNSGASDNWGIRASDWGNHSPASYNVIYNNVVYGNPNGIQISGDRGSAANRAVGNLVKNNIVRANTGYQLQAEYGGENDGMMGSGNVYTYNHLGAAASGFIGWGHGTTKATYAAWYAAYPAAKGNTVQGNPLFVDVSTPDFHLQPSSPAINAGTNVGLTSDYEGNHVPFGPAPGIGAYEYHSGFLKLQPPKPPTVGAAERNLGVLVFGYCLFLQY